MSLLINLSLDEQVTVKLAPFYVFLIVSKADRKIDEKEYDKFKEDVKTLAENKIHPVYEGSLSAGAVHEIFLLGHLHFAEYSVLAENSEIPYLEMLKKIAVILENKAAKEDANLFKKVLLTLAVNIAESAGGWLPIGNNISKIEIAAIRDIKNALNYFDQVDV